MKLGGSRDRALDRCFECDHAEFGRARPSRDRISRYVQFVFSFRERERGRAVSERSLCNARSRQRASLNRARRIALKVVSVIIVRSFLVSCRNGVSWIARVWTDAFSAALLALDRSTSQAQAVVLIDLHKPSSARSLTHDCRSSACRIEQDGC